MADDPRGKPITGWEVYHSPEFKAFCERFGIAHGLPTKVITIRLDEESMTVTQEYPGRTAADRSVWGALDTTTLHNQSYRTSMPRPDHEAGRIDP